MTEEGSSNSDFELKKFQKLKSDHENEIDKLKQSFQQLIDEKIKENTNQTIKYLENNFQAKNEISVLQEIISQKDEKINSLEEQIKKVNDSFEKKIGELTFKLNQTINLANKSVNFVQIKNKWKNISLNWLCCGNICINTNNPIGNCNKGHGFINIIDDENIKYINCVDYRVGGNSWGFVCAENQFNKPREYITTYSLFYYEIKFKFEGKKNGNWLYMGIYNKETLINLDNDGYIRYDNKRVRNIFELPKFSCKNGDIFGCGLVYPPMGKSGKFPYVFFTQNGKQIGKAVLLVNNSNNYVPNVRLIRCDVETNFGNDLEEKPFVYDVTKHLVIKEFYEFFFPILHV
uniref:SPRY domain-containing protein n=1 Tax=Meloidogyne hapla TaxID=6305 RepID=A0A1I8C0T5_MELHA